MELALGFLAFCGVLYDWHRLEGPLAAQRKTYRFGRLLRFAIFLAYLIFALWAFWVIDDLFSNIQVLLQSAPRAKDFGPLASMLGVEGRRLPAPLLLAFDLWAILGSCTLLALREPKLFPFGAWKRSLIGCFALALIVGRLLVGWVSWLLPFLPPIPYLNILIYVIGPPILSLVAGLWGIESTIETIGLQAIGLFLACVTVPIILLNQIMQFDQTIQVYKQQKTGLIGYIVRFGYWLRGERMPEVPDDSRGARFATQTEIENLRSKDGRHLMAFGHVNGAPLFLENEKHVLIMASTRSGKGTSLIIPHLLRYPGSAFVLDPKGENARATGRQRATLNGKVLYLDPFGISGKPQARFNPLAHFTPDNMEAESKALAAALVMGEDGKRDHWTSSAQQLLAALILFVVSHPGVPAHAKSLVLVRHWLLKKVNDVLKTMAESEAADGLVARLATSFLQTPEKEFGSILSTAQRETEILDNPAIAACLSGSGPGEEVDFADWHKGTMSVFLCLSAPLFPVFNRWLRLVLTSALDEMTFKLAPSPLPVCFMLDELATLGHLQPVENAIGLAAGYGVQLVSVFQDTAQMKDLYKGRWASFVGNAGVRALFSLDDYDTANYWAQFMGKHLVQSLSQQQDLYGVAKSQAVSDRQQMLLSPEEIMMTFAQNKMLVLPQGVRPIVSDRVPYFQDAGLSGLWDDPRGLAPAQEVIDLVEEV